MPRRALITGINGQDGTYLTELLLERGYCVVGAVRHCPPTVTDHAHTASLCKGVELVECNLAEKSHIEKVIRRFRPDEVYNLAARASSSDLWTDPVSTGEVNALAVVGLLDVIHRIAPDTRFVQASSSEVFGNATEAPQTESTPLQPRNPYGVAKAYGHWITTVYREQRGLYACSCILYNHESPRRGMEFVTRKISHGVARIKLGLANELRLGNLDARRDWGFAGDYVKALWLSLQQRAPGDYIVATGETHSVREFCDIAFSHVGLQYEEYVIQECEDSRGTEPVELIGNPTKTNRTLGWAPTITFKELVSMLVDADLRMLKANLQTEPSL
jgi:GDPmannose 4,6-dehydratase